MNDAIFPREKQLNNILLIDNISIGCFCKRRGYDGETLLMIKQQEPGAAEACSCPWNRKEERIVRYCSGWCLGRGDSEKFGIRVKHDMGFSGLYALNIAQPLFKDENIELID